MRAMRISLTTTGHMSDETYALLCAGFQKRFENAEFHRVINEEIIGGFIADVDGQIYDFSVASQLAKMQQAITE